MSKPIRGDYYTRVYWLLHDYDLDGRQIEALRLLHSHGTLERWDLDDKVLERLYAKGLIQLEGVRVYLTQEGKHLCYQLFNILGL